MLKAHKFFKNWPCKGIKVLGFIWARYSAKVNFIVLVEPCFRGAVVIKKNEGPGGSLTPSEWAKSICRKTKNNVTGVGEVFVRSKLPVYDDFLPQEATVDVRVKYVRDFTMGVFVLKGSISHFFRFDRISLHGDKARYKRQVVEHFPWLFPAAAINNESILTAVWAFGAVLVLPSETAARINAAVVFVGLEP
jgi:hypothetical protein